MTRYLVVGTDPFVKPQSIDFHYDEAVLEEGMSVFHIEAQIQARLIIAFHEYVIDEIDHPKGHGYQFTVRMRHKDAKR